MKKRLLSIILALTLIASLSACNISLENVEDDNNITGTEQEQNTQDDSDTDSTESLSTETEGTQSNQTETEESETDTNETESSQDGDKDQNDNKDDTNNEGDAGSDDNNDSNGNTGTNDNNGTNGNTGSNDNGGSNDNAGSNSNSGSNGSSGSNDDGGSTENIGSGDGENTGSNDNMGSNDDTGSSVETQYISMYTKEENDLADAVIAKIIRSSMGEFAKVKAIHDYLLMNVDYDYQNLLNGTVPQVSHTAKGALANRYAVCDGYSQAFRLLCLKVGVSCEFVTGTSQGEAHAWNQVKIEGNWYNMDVTWDDPATIGGEVPAFDDHSGNSYEYFCIPDSILNKDHVADNAKYSCTSPSLFERALKAGVPWDNAKYVTSESELVAWIKSEAQKGNYSPEFYIKAAVIGENLAQYCMDCAKKTGIKCSSVSLRYFTYFKGTTDPGTYYKITLTIK